MKVKVQRYVTTGGAMRFGVFVKRWWFPVWVKVDYWSTETAAIQNATEIKHPMIVEIT